MKKIIKLNETDMHNIVKNTVKRVIKESDYLDSEDYFSETVPLKDAEEEVRNMPYKSDEELLSIINGESELSDISTYQDDYSEGYDESEWVMNAAEDEYMKRHKDYAFHNLKNNTYDKYIPSDGKENRNVYDRRKIDINDYDMADNERFKQKYPEFYDKNGNVKTKPTKKDLNTFVKKALPNYTNAEFNKINNLDKKPLHRKGSLNRSIPESKEMKQTIKLTESELHSLIKETVKKVLNEVGDTPKGQEALGALYARQDKQAKATKIKDNQKEWTKNAMKPIHTYLHALKNSKGNEYKWGDKNYADKDHPFNKGHEKYNKNNK